MVEPNSRLASGYPFWTRIPDDPRRAALNRRDALLFFRPRTGSKRYLAGMLACRLFVSDSAFGGRKTACKHAG
jgi:hypothetical protein